MRFKTQQCVPIARPGESGSGLPGSLGRGKSRESRRELGRASPLPTSFSTWMGQATPKPAPGEAGPHAAEAVGCSHSTSRAGEPPDEGRRTRLDTACTGPSDRACKTGASESTFLQAIASKAEVRLWTEASRAKSPVREIRPPGSVRGRRGNPPSYRDKLKTRTSSTQHRIR